jgi:hypothetical protein
MYTTESVLCCTEFRGPLAVELCVDHLLFFPFCWRAVGDNANWETTHSLIGGPRPYIFHSAHELVRPTSKHPVFTSTAEATAVPEVQVQIYLALYFVKIYLNLAPARMQSKL